MPRQGTRASTNQRASATSSAARITIDVGVTRYAAASTAKPPGP